MKKSKNALGMGLSALFSEEDTTVVENKPQEENPTQQNKQAYYFSSLEDALLAYESNKIPLHSYIWVRFDGIIENESKLITIRKQDNGRELHVFDDQIIKKDEKGEIIVQYLLTTPGRILLNKVLLDSLVIAK